VDIYKLKRFDKNQPWPKFGAYFKILIRASAPSEGSCLESNLMQENLDLLDGLRVLTRIGAHFHPGRVRAVEPPFIFAVSLDSERGNKPHIYSKEEILNKVIIEVSFGSYYLQVVLRIRDVLSRIRIHKFFHPGS
jgi:hypothetical protein